MAYLYRRKGAPLEDIIQEGNLGLFIAIERFDETQYRSFSNFVKAWILQSISVAMASMPFLVRLPQNQLARYRKVIKFKEKFEQTHEYLPSINDIEIEEDCDPVLLTFFDLLPTSLSELIEIHDDLDDFESERNLTILQQEDEYNSFVINRFLKRLKNRDKDIVKSFFGLGKTEETLSSIGDRLGLTRERARQILWQSIRKIQDDSHVKRIEAKIGDTIRIISSQQVGRVIKTGKKDDGNTILVVKLEDGGTTEISVIDTPYHIVKITQKEARPTSIKPQKEIKKSVNQENTDTRREVMTLGDLKVGDSINYSGRFCVVKKLISNGKSSKLIVEYSNGVIDVVSYNASKYIKVPRKPIHSDRQGDPVRANKQFKKEAMVGDKIRYGSRIGTVIKKKTTKNSLRLILRYKDGSLDNVPNDWNRYTVL